jgi:hypothetical protein
MARDHAKPSPDTRAGNRFPPARDFKWRAHEDTFRCRFPFLDLRFGHCTNSGPAPQSGMEKPGMTNGARKDGSMDTTGMSATKGNIKRDKDGAPAARTQDDVRK